MFTILTLRAVVLPEVQRSQDRALRRRDFLIAAIMAGSAAAVFLMFRIFVNIFVRLIRMNYSYFFGCEICHACCTSRFDITQRKV